MIERKKPYLTILIAAILWLTAWTATQGIFISEVLVRSPWDINISYVVAIIWVLIATIAAFILFPSRTRNVLPKSKLLWLYAIPVLLLALLPGHYSLSLNIWAYIPMILVTVFWQDYLTFGILQSTLAERLSLNGAAVLTAIIFSLGHVLFSMNNILDPQLLLITFAGFVFAFSRRYTGNIYIANIIHITIYLI